ncbi:RNA polymerase sigma factor [Breznakia pachnodae]|uniref:RNA polymerase sigma factor (Sigma-70 family) n=1 Tax=Breznakia pachnodae TaxID=265178 RepID=A0ABU0E220_9FIRM|nr:RNA polymerase sigma factor [Breznakia pachnodae]MDQ0360942.1 RNA polymerase sigma factor (sigma-70 family) [Breznakia pachnodae]
MDKKEQLTQIVKEVQKDKGQFELLYSQIISRVYYWSFTIVGNEAEAKDVTQEVMIRIYNKLDTLKNPENFTAWMYRLVRNCSLNHLRKSKRLEKEFLFDEETGENTEYLIKENRNEYIPHELYSLNETKHLIKAFIGKLPRRQREVITLYYLEEYKIDEIAEILNYNSGSIRSRLHAGRKNLETLIMKYEEKNNTKIYTLALLPLLKIVLDEQRKELFLKQDLCFDEENYLTNNRMNLKKVANTTVIKVISLVVSSFVLFAYINANFSSNTNLYDVKEDTFVNDINMLKKIQGNPDVESIIYSSFPTKTSVEVSITLKESKKNRDIKIMFNEKEIAYEKQNSEIILQAKSNGLYTIVIDGNKTVFEISTINEYALELVEVYNYKEYIKLNIDDELSQMDFKKSYIEYQDEVYKIDKNLIIHGEFRGELVIMIFNIDGQFIEYFVTIN